MLPSEDCVEMQHISCMQRAPAAARPLQPVLSCCTSACQLQQQQLLLQCSSASAAAVQCHLLLLQLLLQLRVTSAACQLQL